jgi:hypothetical protein
MAALTISIFVAYELVPLASLELPDEITPELSIIIAPDEELFSPLALVKTPPLASIASAPEIRAKATIMKATIDLPQQDVT